MRTTGLNHGAQGYWCDSHISKLSRGPTATLLSRRKPHVEIGSANNQSLLCGADMAHRRALSMLVVAAATTSVLSFASLCQEHPKHVEYDPKG